MRQGAGLIPARNPEAVAVLGIESTAHTFAVGVVEEEKPGRVRVLANQRAMVKPDQGGIHPREAAHEHAEKAPGVLAAALKEANLRPEQLEAIAFSQGPGLGPCLRVGATVARSLAVRHALPLVGVNHCVAHLEIGRGLSGMVDPLLLYASGANTQVLALSRGRYRVFGETLDVGLGNALDKFARGAGIPFPGGPEVERLAAQADRAKLLDLPYVVKGMDMSFSGWPIAAERLVAEGHSLADVCHAIQEHQFAALVEITERALAATGKTELLLGGGVACNARLQEMARSMALERGVAFFAPPRSLLVDNGAMIAWLGHLKLRAGGAVAVEDSEVQPYERTDTVEVTWR